ncbi:MAG: MoaD family protein [Deltaproteobacteria bacterium]|nr:MoaD family protein [Deltaproteobacteria bacterium]
MKIRVKGFLSVKGVMGRGGEIDLDLPEPTIRQALDELCLRCGPEFRRVMFDPETGDPRPENPILVNGRHYRHLLHGLDTPLRNGDLLAVFPPVAGG